METFHVANLDSCVTEEEILEALKTELGLEDGSSARVTSIRPAYGQAAKATIKVTQKHAAALAKKGSLVVGLIACRVKQRTQEDKCYRCWETGHQARDCKGPDKSQLCFKCGKSGHKRQDCAAEKTTSVINAASPAT